MYPFYSKARKDFVVDALCECGHLHTEHDSIFFHVDEHTIVREYMEGKCCCEDCSCQRFRWSNWVLSKDAPQPSLLRRRDNHGQVI
jgi:hypothetical protein